MNCTTDMPAWMVVFFVVELLTSLFAMFIIGRRFGYKRAVEDYRKAMNP